MGYIYRNKGRTVWMMKYYKNGQPIRESTETTDERKARKIVAAKDTDLGRGLPVAKGVGKIRFPDAVAGIRADYALQGHTSDDAVERRVRLHLEPYFGDDKMADITTGRARAYATARRTEGASIGTVNRELDLLRRMFTLAVQGGALLHQPHIPRFKEHNTRTGFFEREAFESVRAHLSEALRGVMTVAYVTGWRIDSEVLPLEWRQVDLEAGELRLDPDTTKNDDGRVFPMTAELVAVFQQQAVLRDQLLQQGVLCQWVFFRLNAAGRRGLSVKHKAYAAIVLKPKRIKRFNKAWAAAARAAGSPGRIPHDFRRTAIRNMVRRGVPERVAMQLCGHKTRAVFERYNIVSPGDLHEARAKLEGLGAAGIPAATGTPTGTPAASGTPAAGETRQIVRKFGGAARI